MTPEEIKSLRQSLDLSQEKFAQKIGVHKITVSRWECGKITPRGLAQKALERLANRVAKKAP